MARKATSTRQGVIQVQAKVNHQAEAEAAWRGDRHAKRLLGVFIERQHECERLHQEWRIAQQHPAFHQRLVDQAEIELRQVADAAMHQLGGFAAGSAAKVAFLHPRDAIATCGSVERNPQPGDAPTDDQYIKNLCGHAVEVVGSGSSVEWRHVSPSSWGQPWRLGSIASLL